MTATVSALMRERIRQLLRVVRISAVIGAVYGVFFAIALGKVDLHGFLVSMAVGVINAGIAGCTIGGIQLFLLRRGRMQWLDALPLVAVIVLKTLVYGLIAAADAVGEPGERLLGVATAFDARTAAITIGLSLLTSAVLVIMFQVSELLGYRTFIDLLRGKYRHPRTERRFFLFVDVVGSTTIAERLGPLEAHRFLAAVFAAVAEPIELCRGEIYQYVGDEIVVTWIEAGGVPGARSLRCFFEMRTALLAAAPQFRRRFAVDPEVRAALHFGEVVAGEIGEIRRAIVFHGDVMNTAARLEQATREHDCRFIASADALSALGSLPGARTRDLGALALRGRLQPIHAFCVEGVDGPAAA
jgi:adenylate cyclase